VTGVHAFFAQESVIRECLLDSVLNRPLSGQIDFGNDILKIEKVEIRAKGYK
jgi:hypothetical protein